MSDNKPLGGDGKAPVFDLYTDLFAPRPTPQANKPQAAATKQISRPAVMATNAAPAMAPRSPNSLKECGLTTSQVTDAILKELYLHGSLLGADIARSVRLPFPVLDEGLRFLKDTRSIEVGQGEMIGRVSYRFMLTDLGRVRAKEAFETCRYIGPAPVPLEHYIEQCRRQAVTGMACTPDTLRAAFEGFIMPSGLLEELGPAVCSGKSIFVFGPPGNGKTMIAKALGRFLNTYGGEIYVPYAITTEGSVITVFDPVLHQTTDDAELASMGVTNGQASSERASYIVSDGPVDLRWRRIKRPVVIVGGELTLDMLELQYNKVAQFYSAPLHVKANGGVFLIDDFGRQLVRPKDLLNRWILPLEDKIDYMTMVTGRKFSVPFEQLIIFSTNLDPKDLVDDAFLRRIRHKVKIDPPDKAHFQRIFELVCRQRQVSFDKESFDVLYTDHYDRGRLPRSSDPRDLLEIVDSICRFKREPVRMSPDLIRDAAQRFFYKPQS
jgi:hypothetical protein